MEKILVASDHAGFVLKEKLRKYLKVKGYEAIDMGAYSKERCDYPDFAFKLAREIASGRQKKGILICKSGIGNSIAANRLSGVRAALCYNVKAARLSREHNDSNVLVLGSAFVNEALARRITEVWLRTEFQAGRHRKRLNKIEKFTKQGRSSGDEAFTTCGSSDTRGNKERA